MKKFISAIVTFVTLLCISSAATAQTAPDSVKTAVIKVGNLTCNGDMPTIKKQLLNQDGIEEVSFTARAGETSVFTITFHSAATTQAQIEKAIETTPGCDDQSETPYRVKREGAGKRKKS